jgi:hypothetical protein
MINNVCLKENATQAGGVAQAVALPSSMYQTLSSNPNATKKKKKPIKKMPCRKMVFLTARVLIFF